MKAFIHGIREDGTDFLGTAFPEGGTVTKDYQDLHKLLQYNLRKPAFVGKSFHIEAFYSWENRYKKADIDLKVKVLMFNDRVGFEILKPIQLSERG